MHVSLKDNRKYTVETGDYQTPSYLTDLVCSLLKDSLHINPRYLIEPTFGIGNFIDSSLKVFNKLDNVYGIELNSNYFNYYKDKLNDCEINPKIEIFNEDIFAFDFNKIKTNINPKDPLLIIGNPPWVTNSQLSLLQSSNLPLKSNSKGLSGLDAITGKANFDIGEFIILQLLNEFANNNVTLAMVCKTTVASNIILNSTKLKFSIARAYLYPLNAKEIFGVNCDAGLLVIQLGTKSIQSCEVRDFTSNNLLSIFGYKNGLFYSNLNADNDFDIDGICLLNWRQGIKHDCAKVMELTKNKDNNFVNGFGKEYSFHNNQYLFCLVKSSFIKSYEINSSDKYVIVTQKKIGDDTAIIESKDKEIYDYLMEHIDLLNNRKSRIYSSTPPFSMFGVGDYAFAKHKVAISGFYKEPRFVLLTGDNLIMLDDTCYYLSFDNLIDAVITSALLNNNICLNFLKSVVFVSSKRPYTKEILKRIDLGKLSKYVTYEEIRDFAFAMKSKYLVSNDDYADYKKRFGGI
jgi:hypothetical protein